VNTTIFGNFVKAGKGKPDSFRGSIPQQEKEMAVFLRAREPVHTAFLVVS
jgi:hypothetical protein